MNHLVFIGPLGGGNTPMNGASIKNYYLLNALKKYCKHIIVIDTEHWKKKPWLMIKILIVVLCRMNSKFVLSVNTKSAFLFLRFFNRFSFNRELYYWVIGGSFVDWISQGKVSPNLYYNIKKIIVEGISMKDELLKYGFKNVCRISNFKKVFYLPKKDTKYGYPRKFVFLSRILPEKGCDYIIEAVQTLNQCYNNLYFVDFYGTIDENYKIDFFSKIKNIPNISYKGFLDLRCYENYNILSDYDVMLFPTYWKGEGFPGIIIDAYIAGLPIIATDWHLNKDIVKDGLTGLLILPHDTSELIKAMICFIIMDQEKLKSFSQNCQQEAMNYDVNSVLSIDVLKEIGLVK